MNRRRGCLTQEHSMSEIAERDARHKARMQRKKALIDEKIAQAQDQYGLLLVHSGNGKGKSSSAFGMVARALAVASRSAWCSSSRVQPAPVKKPSSAVFPTKSAIT